ncbi:MAG: outer membrane protein assembly factor BamA, partial [Armatimonadetes bacterium]|nr:outer membrane protein assembly factor BamA [Armatimonadota bacterium]
RVSAEEVLSSMTTKVGDSFNEEQLNEDLKRISSLGYFYYTGIKVTQVEEGVAVSIEVKEKPWVCRIVLSGVKSFSKDRLLKELQIDKGAFADLQKIETAEKTLEDFYVSQGFNFVKVDLKRESTERGVVLEFTVDEGPKIRVKEVKFQGNEAFASNVLSNLMRTKPYTWLLSDINIFPPGYFDENILSSDVEKIKTFYQNEGYLDVTVQYTIEYTKDKKWLVITILIEEGEAWTIEEVNIVGNKDISGKEIREALKLAKGDQYRKWAVMGDADRILTLYGDRGYIKASVIPKPIYSVEVKQVAIQYTITEDKRYYVERIEILGNYKTKDKVIRRELSFDPSELFNRSEIQNSVQRLRNLGYFDEIDVRHVEGSKEDYRNLIIEVEEGKTAYLLFGFGVSSNYGLVGNIALVQRNFDIADLPKNFEDFISGNSFVGAGQYLRLEAMPGTEYSNFRLDFQEPWLFDEPISFGTSLFAYNRARQDYDEGRLGGSVSLGRRFQRDLSVVVKLGGEVIDIDNVSSDAPDDVKLVEGSNNVNTIGVTVSYDKIKREKFMIPYDGYSLSGTIEAAGGLLGGDFDFVRLTLSGKKHIPVVEEDDKKQVLSLYGKVGLMEEVWGSDFVPVFERFYAGGFGTVRGFQYRTIGPKQADDPVGGKVLALANVEYSFPLMEENVRGIVFWDVGSVYSDLDEMDLGEIRSSVGFGLRIYTPLFGPIPISLDFGFPIKKEDGDETQIFNFNIGAIF